MAGQYDQAAAKTAPDAHLDEFAGVGDHELVEKYGPGDTL